MEAQQLKSIYLDYKKRLIYFADNIVQDRFWAECFASEAIFRLKYKNFDDEKEILNCLYTYVAEESLKYIKAYNKTLSMEQIKFLFFDTEILNEISK